MLIIFYPKVHSVLKRYTRENCRYPSQELEATVLKGMDFVKMKTIRLFAMRSRRRMMAYMNGLLEEQRAFAEKIGARQISVDSSQMITRIS